MTITLDSALPPITNSVLIDGTTQPGYAGIPLISLGDPSPGSTASLAISGGNVTIRGLVLDTVAIDPTTGEDLAAVVHPQGTDAQLSLLGSQGQTLAQSDGLSAVDPDAVVDEVLGAGDYTLRVQSTGAGAAYTWTTMLEPASPPLQPLAVGQNPARSWRGTSAATATLDLAVANSSDNTVSVLLGNGDGTFAAPGHLRRGVATRMPSWPATSPATGRLDLAVANSVGNTVSVLLGNGDGTFQPQVTYAVGSYPVAIVAGDFTGDGRIDLAVANSGDNTCRCSWATATAPSSPRSPTRSGRARTPSWPATSPATGGSTWPSPTPASTTHGVGAPGQRRRHLPAPGHLRGGVVPQRHRGRRLHRQRSDRPGRRQLWQRHRVGAAGQRRRHLPAPGHLSRGVSDPSVIAAGDFTGDGRTDLAVANTYDGTVSVLLGNGDGTFQPQITYAAGSYPCASWRATSLATAGPISPSSTKLATACRCSWAMATAPSSHSPKP